MASTFLVVSVFRGASLRFVNDHFTHLSRARQMLLGEWPLRDFFDPGQFLHYGLSAVVLALWGDSLFGEAILTVGFLALGASLIFGASYTLARSTRVAIAMTILSVIALPRLYNYPKVVLYPAALWVGWWFGTRATPRGRHLLVLAATTVIAALFRYDHGVYIGGAFGVLCLLRPAPCRARVTDLGRFALLCLLCALPYLWYVDWAEGLGRWVVDSLGPAHVVRDVAQRLPMLPALGGTTAVEAISAGRMAEMIALGFSTWVISAVPYVALALCGVTWLRAGGPSVEVRTLTAMSMLGVVVTRALVGNQPSERLADVVGVSAVLGAWIARRGLAVSARWWGNRGQLWAGVALVVLWFVTAVAIGIHARLGASIADAHLLNGPAAVWTNLVETYERLRSRPLEYRAPNGSRDQLDVLAGYARRCTSTNDRLLVVAGFAPQLFFFAERGFAGGQVHFLRRWHDSAQDQLLTLVRLRRQNVPVAFVGADQIGFNQGFSLIAEYVEQQYEETPFAYVGGGPWHVRIKRGMQPVSMDRDTGLPCFAPRA